jgi:tetratricopeptide (TPR) repeat protein
MALRPYRMFVAAAVLLIAAAGAPAVAQDWSGRGRLQGTVTDQQGQPVEGAKITLTRGQDGKGGGPAPLTTNSKGSWSVLGLAGGPWQVSIEKPGFVVSVGSVNVNEFGVVPPIKVTLRPVPPEQQQPAAAQGQGGNEVMDWLKHGDALLKEQKWAEARAEYERALPKLQQPHDQATVLKGVAVTYYEEKNLDQAVASLKKAIELKPEDTAAMQLLVNWLVAAGREPEAKEYMAKLPQGTTIDPNSLLNLGIKAYNEKKLDEAAGYFDRVVREHPELPDAYYYRGLVLLAQNKTADAKADFQKLLDLAPNHPKAAEVKEYLKAL